jgi:hypothetical protein
MPWTPSAAATNALVWAMMLHVAADWMFQTEWMALNKSNLRSPAGWVHTGIHVALLLLVLPWGAALAVGAAHLLVDTRIPYRWWMRNVKRVPVDSPANGELAIWMDQAIHVLVLAGVVLVAV